MLPLAIRQLIEQFLEGQPARLVTLLQPGPGMLATLYPMWLNPLALMWLDQLPRCMLLLVIDWGKVLAGCGVLALLCCGLHACLVQ